MHLSQTGHIPRAVHCALSSLLLLAALFHVLGAMYGTSQPHRYVRLPICSFFLASTVVLVTFTAKGLVLEHSKHIFSKLLWLLKLMLNLQVAPFHYSIYPYACLRHSHSLSRCINLQRAEFYRTDGRKGRLLMELMLSSSRQIP